MPARVAIRRLALNALAPRDHPSPADLAQRLVDAAQSFLPEALGRAGRNGSGEAVIRIRRLEVDLTLDAAFEPRAFASALATAIARELRGAEQRGSSDGVVCYPSRAIYVAALIEALAEGRAAGQWWLRDAEGLRFLTNAQAIRTAVAADARVGLEALASLPPLRRMAVLRALSPVEAERTLQAFANEPGSATLEDAAEGVAKATTGFSEGASALAVYVAAFAQRPSLAGASLAAAARLSVEVSGSGSNSPEEGRAFAGRADEDEGRRAFAEVPRTAEEKARRILSAAAATRTSGARTAPLYRFTPFGGLLLLLPDLGAAEISEAASAYNGPGALVAYAALGLCAGRGRFSDFLDDGLWRELFGIDVQASAFSIAERLCSVEDDVWSAVEPLAASLDRRLDARFLMAPRGLVSSRRVARSLAGLARAATKRFARRLPGFRDASAPFLFSNALGVSAALERNARGWSARLSRAPLDVLISLARVAEGSVQAPSGATIDLSRTPQ
jgi:hypothetical protein